jgi:hypothetical protein
VDKLHILDETTSNQPFEKFFHEHIKKILMIRNGSRYLSKGNYNLTRIQYINKVFPGSKFIIPIRHPFFHVESLVRQHNLFSEYSCQNKNIPEYLKSVGHYEFGPQRTPICVSTDGANRITDAWENGEDALGYAIQWAELYGFLHRLQHRYPSLSKNIFIVRYEEFCNEPGIMIQRILEFSDLNKKMPADFDINNIRAPSRHITLSDLEIAKCWREVKSVAILYDYQYSQIYS